MPGLGPERRGAVRADRRGARDVLGRRAHHLDGPPPLRRRAPARSVPPAARDLRRLGRAARPDAAARGAPRRAHHAGLGHDRDEPARLRRAPAGATRRTTSTGATAPRPAGRRRWSRPGSSTTTARRCPGTAESTGELEVRGPWVARAYYRDDESEEKFDAGWLRTGDIAAIDERGYIMISDRAKDVIKSGGEWISSVELEDEIMAHPAVLEAAVIAVPDERWDERPLACVVPEKDADAHARGAARAPRRRGWRSGGSPTSSRSSTRCPRRASASSTRRCCAGSWKRAGSSDARRPPPGRPQPVLSAAPG